MLTAADYGPELVGRHDLPWQVPVSRPGRLAGASGSDEDDESRIRDRNGRLREICIHGPQRGRTAGRAPSDHRPLAATLARGTNDIGRLRHDALVVMSRKVAG